MIVTNFVSPNGYELTNECSMYNDAFSIYQKHQWTFCSTSLEYLLATAWWIFRLISSSINNIK